MEDTTVELAFLRYFYHNIGEYLGPADDDIYDSIKNAFEKKTGEKVPDSYRDN